METICVWMAMIVYGNYLCMDRNDFVWIAMVLYGFLDFVWILVCSISRV